MLGFRLNAASKPNVLPYEITPTQLSSNSYEDTLAVGPITMDLFVGEIVDQLDLTEVLLFKRLG